MDIFMDKLAQRLTAQDIIQANTAADVEEMNKLKAQIGEYRQGLELLKKLLDEETDKLKNSRLSGENVNRLVDEGIEKIRAIQADTQGDSELQRKLSQQLTALGEQVGNKLNLLQEQINGRLENLDQTGSRLDAIEQQIGGRLDVMERQMESRLGALEQQVGGNLGNLEQLMNEKLEALGQQIDQKLGTMGQQMSDQLGGMNQQVGATLEKLERQAEESKTLDESGLTEKFATLEDNVHKECVKVYRNVQAVVVEENGKQSDAMTETVSAVGGIKGKLGAVLGISAAALLVSLGGILLQIIGII